MGGWQGDREKLALTHAHAQDWCKKATGALKIDHDDRQALED